MMTLAAPWALLAAGLAAAVVVTLHLLAWRRPTPTPLPTARFVPPSAVRAVSRDLRLSDLALLLVRVAALLLAGLALARPAWTPRRSGIARVLVLDASRRVARVSDVADSARVRSAGTDATVWVRVDSVARVLADSSIGARADVRGALGAGLVAGIREGVRLAKSHETVELVVISPFAAESWDASMEPLRAQWTGALSVVRVAAREAAPWDSSGGAPQLPRVLTAANDPVGAAFQLAIDSAVRNLRVIRAPLSADDSAWARNGGLVVAWPIMARADSAAPGGAITEATTQAIVAGDRTVIGRFVRAPVEVSAGRTIARWGDGSPAAHEVALGRGCVRRVGIGVPSSGDAVLLPAFLAFVRQLATPCDGGNARLIDSARLSAWAATPTFASSAATTSGSSPRTSRPAVDAAAPPDHALERWLLLLVATLLGVEWLLRRARTAARDEHSPSTLASREAA